MRKSETTLLPTMKPFEHRRSLHSLLRVQTRLLTNLKHKTLYIDTFSAATLLKNADYKVDISRLQSRREGPPRFQKLSPELCSVLFPAAIPTTAGLASKKPGSVASFVILRELKPAILDNRSTTPSCHDPTGSLVFQLLNL